MQLSKCSGVPVEQLIECAGAGVRLTSLQHVYPFAGTNAVALEMEQVTYPSSGSLPAAVCREFQVTEATYYRWRNQFGGLKADDAKRLKDLERENATLKRLLADAELEKAALKEIARGNF